MDKLHEVDLILAQLEDTAHGEESKKVGMARKLISELSVSNGAKPSVRSSAEMNKKVRHKAIDLLLEITSRWNESGVEIPKDYVTEVQRAIMNIRLD